MLIDAYTRKSWDSMRNRCDDASREGYGALDLSYDPAWNSLVTFYQDMGKRPQGFSLERKNSSKGYSKENCEWSSVTAQNRNRPTLVKLSLSKAKEIRKRYANEDVTQDALARVYGVSRRTIGFVLSNQRWTEGVE